MRSVHPVDHIVRGLYGPGQRSGSEQIRSVRSLIGRKLKGLQRAATRLRTDESALLRRSVLRGQVPESRPYGSGHPLTEATRVPAWHLTPDRRRTIDRDTKHVCGAMARNIDRAAAHNHRLRWANPEVYR